MHKILLNACQIVASGLLLASTAHADILRCADATGKTLFTDSACPTGMHVLATTPTPQACATEECDRRRERELSEARDRAKAEKQELAAMTAQRHQREIEDRRLDEARYEAELRSAEATRPAVEDVAYPVYPIVGFPARCGSHCLNKPRRHRPVAARPADPNHHAIARGTEPVRLMRSGAGRRGIDG